MLLFFSEVVGDDFGVSLTMRRPPRGLFKSSIEQKLEYIRESEKMMFYRAMSMTKSRGVSRIMPARCFNTKSYFNVSAKRRPTLRTRRTSAIREGKREIEWTAENIGRASLGTAGIAGLGALCWYGLGMADRPEQRNTRTCGPITFEAEFDTVSLLRRWSAGHLQLEQQLLCTHLDLQINSSRRVR